ncbi:hypothetical protein IEQ34_004708 [Dendrobium chrysotoxum]|uniref:Uncharacterized protein n=1 Tax=Dendrobium chrysotoxum TaxID=161865 RepID=A0AAV7HH79_DENCH|nr:hypothetical protein IEQ34_004708 [Dendrobium chrysotoxum]
MHPNERINREIESAVNQYYGSGGGWRLWRKLQGQNPLGGRSSGIDCKYLKVLQPLDFNSVSGAINRACNLLAEEGLTPEDGNIEANERVFIIVMGPEHSGRVRTQGFGVTPTRYFPQSKSEEGGGSGSNFEQIASLREEFKSFRDNQMRDFSSFHDEMRQVAMIIHLMLDSLLMSSSLQVLFICFLWHCWLTNLSSFRLLELALRKIYPTGLRTAVEYRCSALQTQRECSGLETAAKKIVAVITAGGEVVTWSFLVISCGGYDDGVYSEGGGLEVEAIERKLLRLGGVRRHDFLGLLYRIYVSFK